MNDALRLGPASPYSVESLASSTEDTLSRVLDRMARGGRGRHLRSARAETVTVLGEIGRWIVEEGADDDPGLHEAFRALALRLRGHSVSLDETLEELEELENTLFGTPSGGEGSDGSVAARLRRALRLLWTEVFRVNRALDRRRDRDRIDAVEHFSDIISHELGNRLGAAQTGVYILRDRGDRLGAERRREVLQLIADGIEAALETVDDVTALTELHALQEDERQPFRDVAVQVARGLRPFARSRNVRIDLDPPELSDAVVDGGRVRLVLSNLMVNAIRYSDESEDERFVRLESERTGDRLVFSVSDNGVGIPEPERERIFGLRVRGRGTRSEGSGMGLTIAAESVAQLGGSIDLESEVGEGTTFRVRLPVNRPAESSD